MKRFRVSIYGLIEDRPVKGVISSDGRTGWAVPARRKARQGPVRYQRQQDLLSTPHQLSLRTSIGK
jgi:hypothetical protein